MYQLAQLVSPEGLQCDPLRRLSQKAGIVTAMTASRQAPSQNPRAQRRGAHLLDGHPFSVRIGVRSYELDALGHVNHAVYHSYDEHARLELLRAAGCSFEAFISGGLSPVLLESRIRFLRELRLGDEVEITCRMGFGEGKTFQMDSTIGVVDGECAAEVECTLGLMDLQARRLVSAPRERLLALATS